MNPWPFVILAYALTISGTIGVFCWSLAVMRRAEAEADAMRGER